eukprot:TRINITY_DN1803_c0_g1_i1.p1 TRINITY_DN1803_c0_g1~~TRINITY_DN1803_c0_g1_i1.p1  ORF type:complete len:429 (-),score=86.31 TRINITY_DN1803_c0_g1_i1:191-1477(-)
MITSVNRTRFSFFSFARPPSSLLISFSFLLLLLSLSSGQSVVASTAEEQSDEIFFQQDDESHSQQQGWIKLTLNTQGPSARVFSAVSNGAPVPPPYNPKDNSGISVFGGTTNPTTYETCFNDLWVLNAQDNSTDGRAWTQIPISSSSPMPEPRALSATAIDNTGTLYLFGGFNGTDWFSDFWSLDLTVIHYPGTEGKWVLLHRAGYSGSPPELCGMSFMWSGVSSGYSNVLILFGGGNDKRQLYNTVWLCSEYMYGDGWNPDHAQGTKWPAAREWHAAWLRTAVHPTMFIFGGYDYGYSYLNDTWRLDVDGQYGVKFTEELPQIAPVPRSNMAVAYSPLKDIAVIWGGRYGTYVYDEVWVFSHSNNEWIKANNENFTSSPTPRFGMASGYFEQGDGMIIFGGSDKQGNVYDDVWWYPFSNLDNIPLLW